jgi:hypothetical protein
MFACGRMRPLEHLPTEVDADNAAGTSDSSGGDETVQPRPAAEIHHFHAERVSATPLVVACVNARTVLAGKGPLRRAKNGRALACSAPFRPTRLRDERLRREHFTAYVPFSNLQSLTYTTFQRFLLRFPLRQQI